MIKMISHVGEYNHAHMVWLHYVKGIQWFTHNPMSLYTKMNMNFKLTMFDMIVFFIVMIFT